MDARCKSGLYLSMLGFLAWCLLPAPAFAQLLRATADGTRKYINILLLFSKYPQEEDVKQAVGLCVGRRAFSDEAVLGVLRNEPLRPTTRLDLSDRPELLEVDNGVRPAGVYDQLLDTEEVAA